MILSRPFYTKLLRVPHADGSFISPYLPLFFSLLLSHFSFIKWLSLFSENAKGNPSDLQWCTIPPGS